MRSARGFGIPGFRSVTGRAGSLISLWRVSAASLPSNGSRPVQISYRTMPRENRSDRSSSAAPLACSGDMERSVPGTTPSAVSGSSSMGWRSRLARPKSRILAWPDDVTMTLRVFRSRWMRPAA